MVDGADYNQPFFGGIRGGERSNQAFSIPQESIAGAAADRAGVEVRLKDTGGEALGRGLRYLREIFEQPGLAGWSKFLLFAAKPLPALLGLAALALVAACVPRHPTRTVRPGAALSAISARAMRVSSWCCR